MRKTGIRCRRTRLALLAVALGGAILAPRPALAKRLPIAVNSAADFHDANPGDGVCETAAGNGVCTLRAAIEEANALAGFDEINFSVPGPATFLLNLGHLPISSDMTITGNGTTNTIIDGDGNATLDRVFEIDVAHVTLSQLTIQNGLSVGANGGGILSVDANLHLSYVAILNNSAGSHAGGGIASYGEGGSLVIDHCEIAGNSGVQGAGIHNEGDFMRGGAILTVTASSIHDNSAGSTSNGAGLWLQTCDGATLRDSTVAFNGGGGIILANQAGLVVIDSTITGNTVSNDAGGGIKVNGNRKLYLYNATITGNYCGIGFTGGGIYVAPSTVSATITNTILAQNRHLAPGHSSAPDDCSGVVESLDYNLIQTTAGCSFTGSVVNTYSGVDPNLGPLQDNGGPTQTFALLPGSVAIDTGNPSGCTDNVGAPLTTDQRGFPRPINGRCDIGSFEFGSPGPLALSFFTLAPCRVIDTRGAPGPLGGPALAAGATRNFVLAGTCSIPASAKAVSANVTVTAPTAAGDLRLFAGGASVPLVSTINYRAMQTRANNAIVTLGASGDIDVRSDQASGAVHFILDVNGYFQ